MSDSVYQVLLIDDDDDDYIVTRDLLQEAEQASFELTWIDSFQAGLEALHADRHDVYLLDYYLGTETGLDLLQSAVESGLHKPIILLTGLGNYDIDRQCMAMGASDYLVKGKPLTGPLLERSILHAIERSQAAAEIRLLTHVLQSTHDGVYMATEEGELLFLNQSLRQLCAYPDKLTSGQVLDPLQHPTLQRLLAQGNQNQNSQQQKSSIFKTELSLKSSMGLDRTVLLSESWVKAQQQTLRFGMIHDITERKQAELERDRFFNLAIDLLFIADADGIFRRINPSWSDTLGYTADDLLGQSFWQLMLPDNHNTNRQDLQDVLTQGQDLNALEFQVRSKDGTYQWIAWNLVPFPQEGLLYGSGRDISQRKASEARLTYETLHDSLTGLDNRVCCLNRLELAIERQKRKPDEYFAVLFVDLDNFKHINDSLGHLVGDQLLIQVAHRLKAVLRGVDEVARLGGDEFLILLEKLETLNDALKTVYRLQHELQKPFQLGHREIFTSASIGVVFSNESYQSVDEIIRDSDIAMYRAKSQGKASYALFDQAMYLQTLHLVEIETALRKAIKTQAFCLYYQPLVNLKSPHQLEGFEVLLRWYHPDKGLIPASEFIPIAEETGQINSIGDWVLRNACQQLKTWQLERKATPDLYLSVNLSGQQFRDPSLLTTLDTILAETQLAPQCLKFEITESSLIHDIQAATETMELIRSRGIELSLDDFGTGFSSLRYLQQFPISTIKIDRSFVNKLNKSDRNLGITSAIINLAKALGFKTIAEGIETHEQLTELQILACDSSQGYLFSEPLPAIKAENYLAQSKANTQ